MNAEIQPSENIENDNVNTKELTDLALLRKINHTVNDVKKQCTIALLQFLTKIESVTGNIRWKILKDDTCMDGIIKKTPWNTACSSKVQREVIQEAEEEEITNVKKSDEGNCFDMFEWVMISLIRLILCFKYLFCLV